MHTRVGVIVETQTDTNKTIALAENLLQKFSRNIAVKPHKEYPDKSYVQQLLRNHNVRSLEALIDSSIDWKNGEEGGIDEKGLFFMSTENPNGQYDASTFLAGPTSVTPDIFAQDAYSCGDIVTPDGSLHRGPILYSLKWPNRQRKAATWSKSLRKFAETYNGNSLVIFDCHS